MTVLRAILATGAVLAIAGCGAAGGGDKGAKGGPPRALADLRTAAGAEAGKAIVKQVDGAIRIKVNVQGLPPGTHGIHIHMTGKCEAPDFASAGGHWNPASKQHGSQNPQGAHSGDLPNLVVAADGTGEVTLAINGATLAALMDADGAAVVVHADPDDLKTDPSGNSGARIACGVFVAQ